jgi:hypothetical protein
MVEAIFCHIFSHIYQIVGVKFGYFALNAKTKCLGRDVAMNMTFLMKVLNDVQKLYSNHARIFQTHLFAGTII